MMCEENRSYLTEAKVREIVAEMLKEYVVVGRIRETERLLTVGWLITRREFEMSKSKQ